ncbi:MAG: UbiA family prenyltransferase [Proteobacteria bacterium]|jgi:4-hydroxybenzoate polyprenyltransferase|nr:UbiA family prenyltransferase [Pseudomonadota bacterium]
MQSLATLSKLIRLPHWSKNLLIFVPLVTAHQFTEKSSLIPGLLAFISFSLAASCTYIINDLADLSFDRTHSQKQKRPLASGAISKSLALLLAVTMLVGSIGLGCLLPLAYLQVLAFYITATLLYSLVLKKLLIVDIVTLGVLFSVRLYAGASATNIEISFWLLAFSFFIFFSLAIVKRYSDLLSETAGELDQLPGRAYRKNDSLPLLCIGIGSGMVAVLVLALYMNSAHIATMYDQPIYLWFLCPLITYWVMRFWIKAHRGEKLGDPVLFALTDSASYVSLALILALMYLAI